MITEEVGRKAGNRVSWRDPWSRSTLSIILPASIAFITVVSKLSLFCSVIWDQSGGISSKQTWIRTFIMAQLDSLPTPSSHTPMGRLQRKLRGWRCRLLSHWGLHHSVLSTIHSVSTIWEVIMRRRATVAQTLPLCVWTDCIPQSDLETFSLEHKVVSCEHCELRPASSSHCWGYQQWLIATLNYLILALIFYSLTVQAHDQTQN